MWAAHWWEAAKAQLLEKGRESHHHHFFVPHLTKDWLRSSAKILFFQDFRSCLLLSSRQERRGTWEEEYSSKCCSPSPTKRQWCQLRLKTEEMLFNSAMLLGDADSRDSPAVYKMPATCDLLFETRTDILYFLKIPSFCQIHWMSKSNLQGASWAIWVIFWPFNARFSKQASSNRVPTD